MTNPLSEVLTFSEACEMWGLDSSTLRHAIRDNRFYPGEYRKSGKFWIILKSAMERVYGKLTVEDLGNCQKVLIPAEYRAGIPDEEISDEFISECLERLRQYGHNISNGEIMETEILEDGSIETYIESLE